MNIDFITEGSKDTQYMHNCKTSVHVKLKRRFYYKLNFRVTATFTSSADRKMCICLFVTLL